MVDYDKFNSKIYLFLSQQADWKTDADYDGDDTITKAEFMSYLKGDVAKEIWDGENCNANRQNDIINRFWNHFDTVRSGKINGTRLSEYNALNDDEEAALEKRFASYKYFNEFFNNEISKIQSAGISELNTKKVAEQLKSSLKTDLLALFESEISKGTEFNSVEDIKNALGDRVRQIEYQTIANISVDLYIEKNVKNLEKKYGYDRENDATLNTLIKNCVSQLASSSNIDDFAGVFNEAMNVIENYLATALPDKFSGNDEYLKKYGYNFNAEDGLNDLQKAVFKTNLANELPNSEYKDLYKEYPYVFEILSEQLVDILKYKEYTTDVIALFKEKMGTKVENAISVAKLFNKPESGAGNDAIETKLWAALKEKGFSDELIEYLQGNGATKLDGIKKEAITATINDEFNDINDKFDINNAVDYIVEKIVAMQLELERAMNSADNLSVDESTWNVDISVTTGGTSGTYSTDGAGNTTSPSDYDLVASKKSAIEMLKYIREYILKDETYWGNYGGGDPSDNYEATRLNPKLQDALKVFGANSFDDAVNKINSYTSISELNSRVSEFIEKVDLYNLEWTPVPSTSSTDSPSSTSGTSGVTTSTKTNLSDNLKFYLGSQVSFKLNPKFNYKDTKKEANIDSAKVTYESSHPDLVAISADGTVTINTDNITSRTKVTIKILVDGEVVGTKELKIEIAEYPGDREFDYSKAGITKDYNKDVVNGKLPDDDNETYKWYLPSMIATDTDKVLNVINSLYNQLLSGGQALNTNALLTAKNKMEDLYKKAIEQMYNKCAAEKRYKRNKNFTTDGILYDGKMYNAYHHQDDDWNEVNQDGISAQSRKQNAKNNDLGLTLWVKTDRPREYGLKVNTQCMLEIFQSFYQAALGA